MSNAKLVKFEEVTPTLLRVTYFDGHLSELISHLTLPIYGAYDGLDEMVFVFLTLPSGKTVTLGEYANSPRTGVDLYVDSKMDGIPAAIYESCQQVGISKSQVVWFRDKFQAEIDQLFAERGSIQEIEKSSKNQEVIYNQIVCFRHSLRIYKKAKFPEYWAMLQYNLGNTYYDSFKIGDGDQGRNLTWAINSYYRSQEIHTKDNFPERWEICQDTLRKVKLIFPVENFSKDNFGVTDFLRLMQYPGYDDVVLANLSSANFSRANLSLANFSGADLSLANFSGADLSKASFVLANLNGANLSGANLSGANLSGANLSGANLSGVNLSGASLILSDFSRTNLSFSNLSGANLSGANLNFSNLSGTNLSGANFSRASLIKAIGISPTTKQILIESKAILENHNSSKFPHKASLTDLLLPFYHKNHTNIDRIGR